MEEIFPYKELCSPNSVSLDCGGAAVDGDDLAGDVRGGGGGEEDGDAFEVFFAAQAVEGGTGDDAVAGALEDACAHAGGGKSRGRCS